MLASRYCCVGNHKFTLVVIEWVFPYTTSPPIPILSFFLFWEVFKALLCTIPLLYEQHNGIKPFPNSNKKFWTDNFREIINFS